MRINEYTLKFVLLLILQVLIWNFCNFSQFLMLAFLPAMILFLPVRRSAVSCMIIAFVCGFAAVFLVGAPLGLSSLALVCVAFCRRGIIYLTLGHEVFARAEDFSPARQGVSKTILSITLATALFLLIYISVDSAFTRPLWIDALKWALSLLLSTPLGYYCTHLLYTDNLRSSSKCT